MTNAAEPLVQSTTPVDFTLPGGWPALLEAIGDVKMTPALADVIRCVQELGATYALIEPDYIDADFRDEYRNFYATIYRPVPNRCRRLHFFSRSDGADRYLGFTVLRPIHPRPVGRTMIVPPPDIAPYVSCRVADTVRPYEERLRVDGFPFMEQDAEYAVCAHVSVWMIALYHHLAFRSPRRLVSDVQRGAQAHHETLRVTPSEGLSAEQVAAALRALDLSAISYSLDRLPAGEGVRRIVCRYLNSRLPILLTTKEHATVLIGYGRDRNGRLFFIRSDESRGPYRRVYASDDPLGRWSRLMVPAPGKVYLGGEAAEGEARRIFTAMLRRDEHAELRRRLGPKLRLRTYLARGGVYKGAMTHRGVPQAVRKSNSIVGTSNWIWVVELQDRGLARETRRCVLAEIAFDATSERLSPSPLFGNFPGETMVWFDPRQKPRGAPIDPYEPYLSGTAVHDAPTALPLKRPLHVRVRSRARRARFAVKEKRARRSR